MEEWFENVDRDLEESSSLKEKSSKEGFLWRYSESRKKFVQRYFALKKSTLFYFDSLKAAKKKKKFRYFSIHSDTIVKVLKEKEYSRPHCLLLQTIINKEKDTIVVSADDDFDFKSWKTVLNRTVVSLKQINVNDEEKQVELQDTDSSKIVKGEGVALIDEKQKLQSDDIEIENIVSPNCKEDTGKESKGSDNKHEKNVPKKKEMPSEYRMSVYERLKENDLTTPFLDEKDNIEYEWETNEPNKSWFNGICCCLKNENAK